MSRRRVRSRGWSSSFGAPRLLLVAEWPIRLRGHFGIPGPDGPAPQNDSLLFTARLTLAEGS